MPLKVDKPKKTAAKPPQPPAVTPKSELYKRVAENGEVLKVSVDDIDPNPFNDREMVGLEELAEQIREVGLLNPVTLLRRTTFAEHHPKAAQELTKEWVLGPGEHRWRATKLAGEREIRGILRDDLAPKIRGVLVLENVHRNDPTPMELARQVNDAMKEDGLSIRDAAKILKMSPTSVHKLTELLKLPADAAEAVHRGTLLPTHARKLLTLDAPEAVSAGYRLMQQHDLKVEDAVRRVLAEGPGAGQDENAPDEQSTDNELTSAETPLPVEQSEGAVPHQTRAEGNEDGTAEPEGSAGDEAKPESSADTEPQSTTVARQTPKSPKATAIADPHAAERDTASADRDAACWSLLQRDEYATAEQVAGAMARALLVPFKQEAARVKAHSWLRKANRLGFDVSNADAYHQAVLSSRDPELIARVTFATALAASEIRAADRRRRTWDQHDAAHVQLLIEATGYVPETDWEVRELTRHNVNVPEKQPTEG
ncbi:ParB/RepB/Spo0J family partition protein [Streptomyces bottropensis]|uniref:ParB/RepB/Spo0J family partition protein n=1 Tax=Streptomyces bottropensis TaxID=42235 RepID=UPI003684719D